LKKPSTGRKRNSRRKCNGKNRKEGRTKEEIVPDYSSTFVRRYGK